MTWFSAAPGKQASSLPACKENGTTPRVWKRGSKMLLIFSPIWFEVGKQGLGAPSIHHPSLCGSIYRSTPSKQSNVGSWDDVARIHANAQPCISFCVCIFFFIGCWQISCYSLSLLGAHARMYEPFPASWSLSTRWCPAPLLASNV